MAAGIELLTNAVLLGGVYALMACGLNLIFGVMRVINFAHGEFLMLGALITVTLVTGAGLPFFAAVAVSCLLLFGLGLLAQGVVVERVVGERPIMALLLTYSLSVVLVNTGILLWGAGYQGLPGVLSGFVEVGGVAVSTSRLVTFLAAFGGTLSVYLFLSRTLLGKAIRAVSEQPEIATICGVPAAPVRYLTFAVGSAMAGLAGALITPIFASEPQMGARFVVKTFTVVVLGGLGSYGGAFAGAMLIGLAEVLGAWVVGQIFATALLYLLMITVLLVRPQGMFGARVRT